MEPDQQAWETGPELSVLRAGREPGAPGERGRRRRGRERWGQVSVHRVSVCSGMNIEGTHVAPGEK